MTEPPEISVLINNYNYGHFLPDAIDSALEQSGVRAEVIVVDDGSTDESARVIQSYGNSIRPIFQENGGQASAINSGVAAARAPILAFLDADDWWRPDKLREVLDAFQANPDAGIVYHRLQPVRSNGRPAFSPIPRSLCSGDLAPRMLHSGGRWPFPMTSSLSVRRSLWDTAGEIPSDFRISADAWITGIFPFLAPVTAIPAALGLYRIHDNTWFRAELDDETLARRMKHWEKTVRITNSFLADRQMTGRVLLRNHFDHRAGTARLGYPGAPSSLSLIFQGLTDQGEPSLLRRLRDTLATLSQMRRSRVRGRAGLETS